MQKGKVSVLMNCYNGEKYVAEAVRSVFSQSYKNWELVFIDNQSEDRSVQIVRDLGGNIKIISTPHFMFLGAARNFGLKYCDGEFIAFLDVDDIWLPTKLSEQIEALSKSSGSFVYSAWRAINQFGDDIGQQKQVSNGPVTLNKLLRGYDVNFQTLVIKNMGCHHFDESLSFAPDYKLCLELAKNRPGLALNKCLVRYRYHGSSLSTKTKAVWGKEVFQILDALGLEDSKPNLARRYSISLARLTGAYLSARHLIEDKSDNYSALNILIKNRAFHPKFIIWLILAYFPYFWRLLHKRYK